METGRRVPGYEYPDYPMLVHRLGKAYGYRPWDIDQLETKMLDWLVAIQGVESELEQEAADKQRAEMKRISSQRRRR